MKLSLINYHRLCTHCSIRRSLVFKGRATEITTFTTKFKLQGPFVNRYRLQSSNNRRINLMMTVKKLYFCRTRL